MKKQPSNTRSKGDSPEKYKYISTVAIVRSYPRNECSIFHNHKIRPEVVIQSTLLVGDVWRNYTLRFVHKRTIEMARFLKPGMRIVLDEGRFAERRGRRDSEFWVRRFSTHRE